MDHATKLLINVTDIDTVNDDVIVWHGDGSLYIFNTTDRQGISVPADGAAAMLDQIGYTEAKATTAQVG